MVELGGRRRVGIKVSLHEPATEGTQDLRLFGEFDALGGDGQTEIAAQCQQRAEEAFGGGIGVDVRDERDVDLDGVQGDLSQAEQ